jgi:hypothetical protein
VWLVLILRYDWKIDTAIEQERSAGYPMLPVDFETLFPEPSGRHAGVVYGEAFDRLDIFGDHVRGVPFFDIEIEPLPPVGVPWRDDVIARSQAVLDRNADALQKCDEASRAGVAWFPWVWHSTKILYEREHNALLGLKLLLMLDVSVRSETGDNQRAFESLMVLWRLGDALLENYDPHSNGARMLIIDAAISMTERLVSYGRLEHWQLQAISDAALASNDGGKTLVNTIVGERVSLNVSYLRASKGDYEGQVPTRLLYWLTILQRDHMVELLVSRDAIEMVKHGEPDEEFQLQKLEHITPFHSMFGHYNWGVAFRMKERAFQVARIDALVAAIAAERFRLDTGHFPTTLSELTPNYQAVVPKDRFSHGSLSYRRVGEAAIFYSTGPDIIDDGGREKRPMDPFATHFQHIDATFTIGDAQRELWPEQWGGDVNASDDVSDVD